MSDKSEGKGYPRVSRPILPDGYGVPQNMEGVLSWEHVIERMQESLNYWISTTRPDGRPHVTPVWGVWHAGCFYFDGSPKTRRVRNLTINPAVVVHLESGDEVVILEGQARQVASPPRALTEPLSAAYCNKYAELGYAPDPDQWDGGDLFEVRPVKVMAWTKFPDNVTRWVF